MSYIVKFIKNWNGSHLIPDDPDAEILTYTYHVNISPDDLKLFGKIRVDGEKYIGDDFFMHTPREAIIPFKHNDFLMNFVGRPNPNYEFSDELKSVLYYDIDGNVLESDNTELAIGDEINDVAIASKEILVQQYSKIIIQISNDSNDTPFFTGLIDKSKTDVGLYNVKLHCVDFMELIDKFGEQLIKVINGFNEDNNYDTIVSPSIIAELIDKISGMTNLSIMSDIDYLTAPSSVYDFGEFPTADVIYDGIDRVIKEKQRSPYYFFVYTDNSKYCYYCQIYYSAKFSYVSGGEHLHLYLYTNIKYFVYDMINETLDEEWFNRLDDVNSVDWEEGVDDPIEILTNWVKDVIGWNIDTIKESLYDSIGTNIIKNIIIDGYTYFVNNNVLGKVQQNYYSTVIPIYENTYKYKDLLRTILYLNVISLQVNGFGEIIAINKDIAGSDNVVLMDSSRILKPYSVKGIESKDFDISPLDIVWYDFVTDGYNYAYVGDDGKRINLDTYIKQIYNTILSTYPIELSCYIRKINPQTGNVYYGQSIHLHERIYIYNTSAISQRLWGTYVINELLLDDLGYKWKVKALKVE